MNGFGKQLLHSTYEHASTLHEMTISQTEEIVNTFNSEIKEIRSINQDMQNYIDIFHKESERCEAYPEQSTEHLEIFANIALNSYCVISRKEKLGMNKTVR